MQQKPAIVSAAVARYKVSQRLLVVALESRRDVLQIDLHRLKPSLCMLAHTISMQIVCCCQCPSPPHWHSVHWWSFFLRIAPAIGYHI